MSLFKGEVLGGGDVRDEDGRVIGRNAPPLLLVEKAAPFANTTGKVLRVVSAFVEITTGAAIEACSHIRVLDANNNHLFVDNTGIQPQNTVGEHMWAVGLAPAEHKETGTEPVFTGCLPPDLFIPPGGEVTLQIKSKGGAAASAALVITLEELP